MTSAPDRPPLIARHQPADVAQLLANMRTRIVLTPPDTAAADRIAARIGATPSPSR